jgi:hypothetical protein
VNIIFSTLKKILFWCYDRGTWQYDLLCVLILGFIFLAPNWIFNTTGRSTPDHAVATRQVIKAVPEEEPGHGSETNANPQPGDPRPDPSQKDLVR